ncbi:MAG TPA: GPW/gp25 family protein [Candidatus Limnocylindrales bacterium]|jgi:phage baseplate assembly protein W|nr:GPW/gp25 family protein [Candidatus Limnocylindrales bacterium]
MAHEFVGSGWAFPLQLDRTGGFALVTDDREIEQAIRLILGTAYGERPMRPDFGCRIHDFVFAEADAGTAGDIASEVRASLRRWEPRIDVDDVVVTIDEADRSLLYVDVRYHIRDTNDPRNLVFPFYTIPGEPGRRS